MPAEEVLIGQRILLRPPQLDDAEELFANVGSDPKVTKYLSWMPHPDVGETRRVITELLNVGDDHTWAVVLRDTGKVVGELGYRQPRSHAVQLGYCLGREWWGRGIMSEAVSVLMQRLQQDSRISLVSAVCHVDNVGSAKLLEKSGLVLEGRLARYLVFPNLGPEPQDCLLYTRTMK